MWGRVCSRPRVTSSRIPWLACLKKLATLVSPMMRNLDMLSVGACRKTVRMSRQFCPLSSLPLSLSLSLSLSLLLSLSLYLSLSLSLFLSLTLTQSVNKDASQSEVRVYPWMQSVCIYCCVCMYTLYIYIYIYVWSVLRLQKLHKTVLTYRSSVVLV